MPDNKGCCLIIACSKEKYTSERFKQWDNSISYLIKHIPVFYVFGKSNLHSLQIAPIIMKTFLLKLILGLKPYHC